MNFLTRGECPKCEKKTDIIKSGVRQNVKNDVQVFWCKTGRHHFGFDIVQLWEVREEYERKGH